MRIISGIHKGKRLIAPRNLPVRPTTDFAKEGLFNILRNRYDLGSVSVLDLFAGTGNISFEFASRGADRVTAVDRHSGCIKYIFKTAGELDMTITTVKLDVIKFLQRQSATYDIIFADPPYDINKEVLAKIADLVVEKSLLNEEGVLIMEHPKHIDLSELNSFSESRKYGGSVFSFFS